MPKEHPQLLQRSSALRKMHRTVNMAKINVQTDFKTEQ